MTLEEFDKWLDSEIERIVALEDDEYFDEGLINKYLGQIQALRDVKEKFKTILPPAHSLS